MTTLFDLLGYEVQTVIKEDGNDDYEDPAYIAPPLKPQEPERRSPLARVTRMIEMCTGAMTADNPVEYSSFQTVAWSEIRILDVEGETELSKTLTAFFEQFFSSVAIAPVIEDEKPPEKPESIIHPKPEKIKGSYIEEKTIRKNGKVVGVYQYQRWRENGKLKSKYLGSKPKISAP